MAPAPPAPGPAAQVGRLGAAAPRGGALLQKRQAARGGRRATPGTHRGHAGALAPPTPGAGGGAGVGAVGLGPWGLVAGVKDDALRSVQGW